MPISADNSISIPVFQPDQERHRRRLAEWAAQVNQGKIQAIGNVTLAASTVSTDVADARVGINSYIQFMPMTANALSAFPTVLVSTIGAGSFSVVHSNTAAADKTFRYLVIG